MSIALIITDRNCDLLVQELKYLKPSLDIQVWPYIERPSEVTFAILWKQPKDYICQFKNLKAVTSLGAGVDFIESDKSIKANVPILRIVTQGLKQQMSQYVLSYLLPDFRKNNQYALHQSRTEWEVLEMPEKYQVGFLGLGEIGTFVAEIVKALGFEVKAWTQSQIHSSIECSHGEDGLKKILSESDCVVGLLPLNSNTKGLLNLERFKNFKNNSTFIQVGRGGQIVESDLIKALDQGLLKQAVIDVFENEPLPKESRLWSHSKITITPHNSARSDNKQTALEILKLYERHVIN